MKILDRYILRQYVSAFAFGSLAFLSLFILIDVIEKVDDYIDRKATFIAIMKYYFYYLPEILELTAPISGLLAALFVTGNLSKLTELTAMKSGGISLYRLLVPFLIVGAVITAIDFLFSGWVVPSATREKQKFESVELGRSFWSGGSRSNFNIIDNPQRLVCVSYFDDIQNTCYNVSVQTFYKSMLTSRYDAKKMEFDTVRARWVMRDVAFRNLAFIPEQLSYVGEIDSLIFSFSLKDLRENTAALELMSLPDHQRFIELRQKGGFESTDEALVKFYSKISFPFACMIVILIGVPLSSQKKRSGLALEVGVSLLVGFIYIGLQQTFATLGYKGAVTPLFAAWFPNLMFLATGLVMLWRAQK